MLPFLPHSHLMDYDIFTGGVFETNCYLFEAPGGALLFDAS